MVRQEQEGLDPVSALDGSNDTGRSGGICMVCWSFEPDGLGEGGHVEVRGHEVGDGVDLEVWGSGCGGAKELIDSWDVPSL